MMLPQSRGRVVTQSLSRASEEPEVLNIAWIGDSNTAGFSAVSSNATGPRLAFQRTLREAGIMFRMVGRGLGATNGTGFTWGRYVNPDDFHDKYASALADPRHSGHGGRRLTYSSAITSIDAAANTLTVPGHTMTVGVACTLDFSQTNDPPVFAVTQGVYYAATVALNVVSLSQYEGSTTPVDILSAGSGTVLLNEGLIEMLPGIVSDYDVTPTDVIASGGTNDLSALISGGASEASALATLKDREILWEARLNYYFPQARKRRLCLLDFMDDTPAAIAASNVVHAFNAWLISRASYLGSKWEVIHTTAKIPASAYADNVHLLKAGYEMLGKDIGEHFVRSVGGGREGYKVPRPFVRRLAQASAYFSGTSDRITFPAQAALNPGANPFCFAVWFYPFALPTGTNVIVMQESPYSEGCMLTHNGTGLNLYHKSAGAGAVISVTGPPGYTHCMKQFRWHRLFAFIDPVRGEAALFCNGELLQRTNIAKGTSITSQDGWCLGAFSSFASALGLYQDFIVGHGANLSLEDVRHIVEADYYDGVNPPGTTFRAKLDEGTGTVAASTVHDTTAGTLSANRWADVGRYPKTMDDGYERPMFSSRIGTVTSAYTATYWEHVQCDPSAGPFTVALPTAVGHDGARIVVSNATTSTNVVTLDPSGAETIDAQGTIPGLNTPRGSRTIEARGGAWVTVGTS
ncbi:hypothetical protein [Sorangium sp. So ce1000]|uniref:hypothetical protein n=1 Tax=Sorangium sp. So ce1000 TaxID=3133325 RepID=UPI003F5E968B